MSLNILVPYDTIRREIEKTLIPPIIGYVHSRVLRGFPSANYFSNMKHV